MSNRTLYYVDDAAGLAALVERLDGEQRIALDTESNSLYRYHERVCLMQLSTATWDALIDPLAIDDLSPLGPILADPGVEVVLHGADYDVVCLRRDFGFTLTPIFDTMIAARLLGYEQVGLAALLERHFGIEVDKTDQRSDWTRRPLTEQQLAYARQDTCHLLELRDRLARELEAAGRMAWAREEFALVAAREWTPREFSPEDFRRISGSRDLDESGRRVLRALYSWREKEADQVDLPPFRVVANPVLLQLARRPPASRRDLAARGVRRQINEQHGDEILAVVRQALASTEPVPARDPRPRAATGGRPAPTPAERQILTRLKAWRRERAAAEGLDPGVLCPNAILEAVVMEGIDDLQGLARVPGMTNWRLQSFGSDLLAAARRAR